LTKHHILHLIITPNKHGALTRMTPKYVSDPPGVLVRLCIPIEMLIDTFAFLEKFKQLCDIVPLSCRANNAFLHINKQLKPPIRYNFNEPNIQLQQKNM
jgi:hypothetical protein